MAKLLLDNDNSAENVAAIVHRSLSWVEARLDLLRFPPDVLTAVHNRKLSVAAARHLALVTDDEHRTHLLDAAVRHGATAKTTAQWLYDWRCLSADSPPPSEFPSQTATPRIPTPILTPCAVCNLGKQPHEISILHFCHACATTFLASLDHLATAPRRPDVRESGLSDIRPQPPDHFQTSPLDPNSDIR